MKDGVVLPTDSSKTIAQASPVVDSAALKQPFGAASFGTEQLISLENERIAVKISTKGGRVKTVELKEETNFDGSKLVLFDGDQNRFGLEFNIPAKRFKPTTYTSNRKVKALP